MKAALYIRVFTKSQDLARQIQGLTENTNRHNLEITHTIEEKESAFCNELYE